MRKTFTLFILFIQLCSISFAKNSQDVYDAAVKSGNKVFTATWPYQFKENDNLYGLLTDINMNDKDNATKRYSRMLHTSYLNAAQIKKMQARIDSFAENTPTIISFIEKEISKTYHHTASAQHLSVYGSYLYNEKDPDDVDMLVVVDSPYTIFDHLEFSSSTVLGSKKGALFPKMSFQVMDYNTYLYAKEQTKDPSAYLTRGEKMALQQLTLVANWFYTVYGFDLRFENTKSLKAYMTENYLNKAFNTLNGAGARLYKTAASPLPYETEPVRLRKVVSRLLITDYIISVLNKSYASSPKTFDQLYNEIRILKDYDYDKFGPMTAKIESLYLDKLNKLLKLAEKHKKLDYLEARSY